MSESVRATAGSVPASLLRRPGFWLQQPALLLAISMAIVSVIALAPFTYGAASGMDVILLVLVHLLGVWGAAIAARSLAVLAVEQAILGEIDRKGTEVLREVRTGRRARIDLDLLEQAIVPSNPSDPPPAMVRLFQHILKEAKDRKFESSVHVMQPYREELLDDLFRLQSLQKIALWLGILGTFIGLLLAIGATDLRAGDFMAVVQRMFDGLVVAFSASLAGLQVAVFLGVLLLLIRKRQERYNKRMEGGVVTMLSLARNSINQDEFMAEFGQIAANIDALTERVRAQTAETARHLEGTRRDLQEQTETIRSGIARLGETRDTFDGFLKNLGGTQAQFIDEVRGVYDTLSLKELSLTLHGSLTQVGQHMAESIGTSTRQIANRLTDFNSAVDQLVNSLDNQSVESAEYAKTLAAQIAASTTESTNAMRLVAARLQEMATREQSIRGDLQELSRTVAILSNAINRLDNTPARPRGIRDLLGSLRR